MPKSPPPETERHLLERALHDAEAFRALYRHYFPRIYGYVAYRVGRAADAEDVVAEVFIKVLENLAQFEYRGEGSFAAWIFRIAHNAIGQFYRRENPTDSLDDLPDLQSDDPLPDQTVQRTEQFRHLREQVMQLSPRRQEIITLKFFGGLRNTEIAAVLGLDEHTVAAHLSRALADLQRQYQTEESP
ncbi:MAG: sigma-70 family RNA polymerase sigma factor [Anaerolineae bacterium]|nr:sigma-70 family RNA polymerase sigma factor [Anaerolineae bacterium]